MKSAGIDTARAEARGQPKVCGWNEVHLDPAGHFDQHRMLALIEEELKLGVTQGFSVSRAIGHMEWALEAAQAGGLCYRMVCHTFTK